MGRLVLLSMAAIAALIISTSAEAGEKPTTDASICIDQIGKEICQVQCSVCPTKPPVAVAKKKKKAKKPVAIAKAEQPCHTCPPGLPGPKGEDGQDGKDGRDGQDGKDGKDGRDGKNAAQTYRLAFGAMGGGLWPAHTYNWWSLPAIFLNIGLNEVAEINLMAGYGPYLHGAAALKFGVTGYARDMQQKNGNRWFGISLSAYGQLSGLKAAIDDGVSLALMPAVVFRPATETVTFRIDVGLLVGYSHYVYSHDLPPGMKTYEKGEFVSGFATSVSVGWNGKRKNRAK